MFALIVGLIMGVCAVSLFILAEHKEEIWKEINKE